MEIEHTEWDNKPPVASEYVRRFERVAALFEYDPRDPNAGRRRAEWLDRARPRLVDRKEVAVAVAAFNRRIGNSPLAIAHAESLADPQTLAVVGGQQAGLFTGPLLVWHKAITIVAEARRRQVELGRPVVPVFWIAGEDHDWEEIDHTYLLGPEADVREIRLARANEGRTSASLTEVSEKAWADAVAAMRALLPDTEHKRAIVELLEEVCSRPITPVEAFARLMARLFGDVGLVLIDSADLALRRAESAAFGLLVEQNERVEAALAEGLNAVKKAGFEPSIEIEPGRANLFWVSDSARLALFRSGDRFHDRRGTISFGRKQLQEQVALHPERLSNNVVTRPWMQDAVLPVVAAVLGPSEISYWAALKPVFSALGGQMPLVVPRLEFTLVDDAAAKRMRRFGLAFSDVVTRLEQKYAEWLRARDQYRFRERLEKAARDVGVWLEPIVRDAERLDPGLRKSAERALRRVRREFERLAAKAERAALDRDEAARFGWMYVRSLLLPLGRPQERVLNGWMFVNKWGKKWIHGLIEAELPMEGRHWIVRI
ncbi:MAG: bacillithiol biosynthesis cysteine-adding enzyme BshC [Candidatus Reconcilbacillus cellulovorans]|uniref:Putative cysteine ligase BshC n=1 Tax=Candidatus Reconcilbacillus cellulovorans TaxID=1906605 RepID=A0A2A6E338_9BACL|nr:MAG: bacillithiol biosynthesis cysteine-adding enzyme BshC [Candidatus Reconcilbacillus cellulovorans]